MSSRKISQHPLAPEGTTFDGTEVSVFNKDGVTYQGVNSEVFAYKADLDGADFTGPVTFGSDVLFTGPVTGLDLSAVGLDQVDNTSDADKPVSNATQDALDLKIPLAQRGVADGVASLDGTGKVPSAQLPAGVDAVQEYANRPAFPATGASNIIYIAADTSKSYRWGSTAYFEIVASPGSTDAVTEGTTNLYFTAARVRSAVLTGLSLATNAAITASDTVLGAFGKLQAAITAHFGSGGTAHATATTSVAGFLSSADKTKLDSLSVGGGSASNITGGTANALVYQSATNTTGFTTSQIRVNGASGLSIGTSGTAFSITGAPGASASAAGAGVTLVSGAGNAAGGNGGLRDCLGHVQASRYSGRKWLG